MHCRQVLYHLSHRGWEGQVQMQPTELRGLSRMRVSLSSISQEGWSVFHLCRVNLTPSCSLCERACGHCSLYLTLYRRQGSRPFHRKEMQKSRMAVWGGLTNSCEKKRSEKQRRKVTPPPLQLHSSTPRLGRLNPVVCRRTQVLPQHVLGLFLQRGREVQG